MKQIKISYDNMSALINYHGAELRSLNKDGKEYMWQADPLFWNRTSPVLFPFVGQVAGGVYRCDGTEYKMGQHGFARDMEFELLDKTDSSCYFLLKSNEETFAKYPYDFELKIGYELSDKGLKVIWEVQNPKEKDLHFSIGAHPAFNCILNETTICILKDGKELDSFENAVFGKGLLTSEKENISLDNGKMKLDEHSFDGDAYVIEDSQADEVQIMTNEGDKVLSVKFESPLVGIWSPPGKNAPFLCIEPWYGRADKEGFDGDISEREWGNVLPSHEKFSASYCIDVL
ncbi:MAG: aldose 1-epimerase family protein [Lachnospiraceae bacterium]|nr:aldose 1-epimerase family protein [Lachnospiraceae bacterium]